MTVVVQEAMESTVNTGLQNQCDASEYFQQKLAASQFETGQAKADLAKAQRELADCKMRLTLEKVRSFFCYSRY